MESRKEDIIKATIELCYEKGLDLTSMQDIAGVVGITKSTIYSHFKSKKELMQEVFNYCTDLDIKACNEGINLEKNAIEKLCRRFANIINYRLSHPKESKIEQLFNISPVHGEIDMSNDNQFYRDIEEIVRQGQEDGDIRKDPVWLQATMYYGFAAQMYIKFSSQPELWDEKTKKTIYKMIQNMFSI